MKIVIDKQDVNVFYDVTLSLDLDFENNRIAFAFIQKDGDKMKVIKQDCFEVYNYD